MSAPVLVIDKIPVNLQPLGGKLAMEYYNVITANRGAEVACPTKSGEHDCIVLAAKLPAVSKTESHIYFGEAKDSLSAFA